jgi:hypothetical protein
MGNSIDRAILEQINRILHHQHRAEENIKKRTMSERESEKTKEELDKVTLNSHGLQIYEMVRMCNEKADKSLVRTVSDHLWA